jgi:hypothetical protein
MLSCLVPSLWVPTSPFPSAAIMVQRITSSTGTEEEILEKRGKRIKKGNEKKGKEAGEQKNGEVRNR